MRWPWRQRETRTSWVYCPNCRRDLNGDNESFVSDDEVVIYECATCGHVSRWCFDFPAPALLDGSGRPVGELRTTGDTP